MSILKNSILFIFLLFAMTVKAQTVIDFIRMIDTTYQPYQEGEYWANDSLIDIKNGYYQRGFSFEGEQGIEEQKILRQVTVFANNDGIFFPRFPKKICYLKRLYLFSKNSIRTQTGTNTLHLQVPSKMLTT